MNKMFNTIKQHGSKAALVVGSALTPVAAFAGDLGDAAAKRISAGETDAMTAGVAMVGVVGVILVVSLIIGLMRR